MGINTSAAIELLIKIKSKNEAGDNPEHLRDDILSLESIIAKADSKYKDLSIIASNYDRKITVRLLPFNVVAIESDGRFTKFYTTDGSKYLASRLSLLTIECMWGGSFVRISRNALVNPKRVERVIRNDKDGHLAILINSLGVFDVSRRQFKVLKDALNNQG